MKAKQHPGNRAVVLLVAAAFAAAIIASPAAAQPLSSKKAEEIIAARARNVILALKGRNMARLSQFVHPVEGLRFSPYNYVRTEKKGDRVFTRRQVRVLFADKKRYLWGEDDSSGDPIRMTFARYYRHYVFDHDFSGAKQVTYNGETRGGGTIISNIREVYPQAIVVKYHFDGFEEKYGGMDWKSLWLVFGKKGSSWYLIGIVHGEWTV